MREPILLRARISIAYSHIANTVSKHYRAACIRGEHFGERFMRAMFIQRAAWATGSAAAVPASLALQALEQERQF